MTTTSSARDARICVTGAARINALSSARCVLLPGLSQNPALCVGESSYPIAVLTRASSAQTCRSRGVDYSIRRPLIALEITSCWICSVPSKMS